jgi:WD40 repeat protein
VCTHVFKGHGGVVSALTFCLPADKPKEAYLITGSTDARVRVFDLIQRKLIHTLEGHSSVVRGLGVSPDGDMLVSGSRDRVVNVWSLSKGRLRRTIPVLETIEATGLCHGEAKGKKRSLVYTGGDKGIVRLWDPQTGEEVQGEAAGQGGRAALVDVLYVTLSQRLWLALTEDVAHLLGIFRTALSWSPSHPTKRSSRIQSLPCRSRNRSLGRTTRSSTPRFSPRKSHQHPRLAKRLTSRSQPIQLLFGSTLWRQTLCTHNSSMPIRISSSVSLAARCLPPPLPTLLRPRKRC